MDKFNAYIDISIAGRCSYAVVNKKTGYSVWDNQEKVISEDLSLKKWAIKRRLTYSFSIELS